MESSEDLESSDFWEDFSQHSNTSSNPDARSRRKKPIPPQSKPSKADSIFHLRRSKYSEEKQVRVTEQETIRKYIKDSVSHLKKGFDDKLQTLRSDNSIFISELYHKSRDFQIVFQYLIDNEVLITQNRILSSCLPRGPKYSFEDRRVLTKELNMTKTKIEALKKTTKIFRDDTENSAEKLQQRLQVLQEMKNNKELQDLLQAENAVSSPVLEKPDTNERIRQELQDMKEKMKKELRDLEENCEKGRETIESLQKELKMAKKVIQNPQLKNQVYSKLRDYLDDFESDERLSISSSNVTFNKRRRVYSNKVTSNLVLNITDSKPSTAPETTKFKFNSLKPTLHTSKSISKPIFFASKRG
jgi:hypothetical protein